MYIHLRRYDDSAFNGFRAAGINETVEEANEFFSRAENPFNTWLIGRNQKCAPFLVLWTNKILAQLIWSFRYFNTKSLSYSFNISKTRQGSFFISIATFVSLNESQERSL